MAGNFKEKDIDLTFPEFFGELRFVFFFRLFEKHESSRFLKCQGLIKKQLARY